MRRTARARCARGRCRGPRKRGRVRASRRTATTSSASSRRPSRSTRTRCSTSVGATAWATRRSLSANPGIDPWLPGDGAEILIPTRFILPDAPRDAIVVNLPEHRLYYFPPAKPGEPRVVRTYPISTAKMDWNTPLGVTRIVTKEKRPNWYPPESVREEHEKRGDPLPRVVPPGARQPARRAQDAPGHSGRRLPHSRHESAGWRRHAGDPRLHTHVPGRRRRALRSGEHQYARSI